MDKTKTKQNPGFGRHVLAKHIEDVILSIKSMAECLLI